MSKIFLLFCLNSLLFFNIEKGFANDNKYFHPPQTDAEKRLDEILSDDMKGDKSLVGFDISNCLTIYNKYVLLDKYVPAPWLDHKGEKARRSSLIYAKPDNDKLAKCSLFFTNDLMERISAEERAIDNGECIEGDMCGFNHGPLTCSQDVPDKYFYHSDFDDKQNTINIKTIWVLIDRNTNKDIVSKESHITYRFIKDKSDNIWKIDDVICKY